MSEVLGCKVHLKLQLDDVVEKEEQQKETINYASHVAQQVEKKVVAPLLDYALVARLNYYNFSCLSRDSWDVGEHVDHFEAFDCVFDAEWHQSVFSCGLENLELIVIGEAGFMPEN